MILLSVILPVYNAEDYVFDAISSILNQSFKEFELIIINDGSTDNSLAIIKEFNDNRIILIDQLNRGLIETLNLGLSLCRGKYIARMDADDIAHPKRFEFQLNAFEKDKDLVLCSAGIEMFTIDGFRKKRYYPLSDSDIRSEFLFNSGIVHPLSMFVGSIVKEHNIEFNKTYKYCEDYKFFYDLLKHGKVINISKFLLSYRVVPTGQTSLGLGDASDRYIRISGIHRYILNDYDIKLSEDWLKLHYSLSLSSEIQKLTIDKYFIDYLLDYSRVFFEAPRFNTFLSKLSIGATLGEKFLKVILFHKRKVGLVVLRRLIFHKFTLMAVFKRLVTIVRYEW
ncbi:glycosyltransferase family 2 protein [Sphingobacterium multivorum]|uniref:glycosyltransferase family 2 protein n=1 Tax=Sphingobacterium multivorum TaxID=28454 RepID=UPI00345E7089